MERPQVPGIWRGQSERYRLEVKREVAPNGNVWGVFLGRPVELREGSWVRTERRVLPVRELAPAGDD